MALLDGGATHGLREATAEERNRLIPVEVELAAGSATLYRVENHRTLLSLTPVEAIVPLHRIVEMGYRIDWNRKGCRIFHRHRGVIECSLRSGCPVLPEADGLELLKEMEHDDARKERVSREVVSWWRERFPDIPDEVLGYMRGQEDADYDVEQCPWNRRQRRQHLRSRGVALNLFSGKDTKSWRIFEQKGYTVLHVDIENGSQFDLHRVGTWAYLVGLCRRGRVVAIVGGPPCRSVSRLRHRRPGPRPLRDRGDQRWGFDHLEPWEKDLVNGDTALMFKQIGLWLLADEFKASSISPFFVLENPQDPADYMEDEALKEQYPSSGAFLRWDGPRRGWVGSWSHLIKELWDIGAENLQLYWSQMLQTSSNFMVYQVMDLEKKKYIPLKRRWSSHEVGQLGHQDYLLRYKNPWRCIYMLYLKKNTMVVDVKVELLLRAHQVRNIPHVGRWMWMHGRLMYETSTNPIEETVDGVWSWWE